MAEHESHLSKLSKRPILRILGPAVLGAALALGAFGDTSNPVPNLQSDSDYRYLVVIHENDGESTGGYTNDLPIIETDGDTTSVIARNFYCPNWDGWEKKTFGCNTFSRVLRYTGSERFELRDNVDYLRKQG